VLDFVGQANKRFRWDLRLRALTGADRSALGQQVRSGFPYLPSGSAIHLDRRAREVVLASIENQVVLRRPQLIADVRGYGDVSLAQYLAVSEREASEIYARATWSELRRSAGLPVAPAGPDEATLLRRVARFLRVDDVERIEGWRAVLAGDPPTRLDQRSEREQRLLRMLYFSLWPDGGGRGSYEAGFAHLWKHPAVVDEMVQVLGIAREQISHVPVSPDGFDAMPLWAHARPLQPGGTTGRRRARPPETYPDKRSAGRPLRRRRTSRRVHIHPDQVDARLLTHDDVPGLRHLPRPGALGIAVHDECRVADRTAVFAPPPAGYP
jgi:hypothetical protein